MPTYLISFKGNVAFIITDEADITSAIESARVKCWLAIGKTVEVVKAERMEG